MNDRIGPDDLDALQRVAFRAMTNAELRFSVLIDETFIIRWISDSVTPILGKETVAFVGTSASDHVHPENVADILDMFAYEYLIQPDERQTRVRNVHDTRLRHANGHWVTLEGHFTNFVRDKEIGMFLVDFAVQSQHRLVDEATAIAEQGGSVPEVLSTLLRRVTRGTTVEVAAVVYDENQNVLVQSFNAPRTPVQRAAFASEHAIEIVRPGSGTRLGELRLFAPTKPVHPIDRNTASFVARDMSLVIDRDMRLRQMTAEVMTDPLTGLANRRAVTEAMNDYGKRHEEVLVAYLDLDGFKGVNDSLGHSAGDEALRIVAARLREALRPTDVIARFGGDEFVVIMPRPFPKADVISDRLKLAVSAPIVIDGNLVHISTSIGITVGVPDGEDMLIRSDHSMMATKQKNRTF